MQRLSLDSTRLAFELDRPKMLAHAMGDGDEHAQRTWHFPLNKSKRDYQYDIIQQCLMKNTLVALPTGLGKTFISAVVMYNFYRWFPAKSIVFLAPTKPLVTQQMAATLGTVEIDPGTTVELTGAQSPNQRAELWKTKRVFFLTPQVLQNDLHSGACDVSSLCLCVFDEAHRALGNHAYCEIVKVMMTKECIEGIRIIALTATPASNVKTVQQLIDNLAISSIAIRTEESLDVRPYLHTKREEIVVVPESEEIKFIRNQFESLILKPYLEKLNKIGAILETDPSKLAPFSLLQARDQFRRRRVQVMGAGTPADGAAEGIFAVLISLYHAYELLQLHGIVSFKNYLTRLPSDSDAAPQSRIRNELAANPAFAQLLAHIQSSMAMPHFVSHPKVDIVERILLQHFVNNQTAASDGEETRAIVFSQFRESVFEIVAKLNVHVPLLKVMSFVGQSGASSSGSTDNKNKSITQKQQMEVSCHHPSS